MDLDLGESLYAFNCFHKQANNLISEMSNKELDSEDLSTMKKFGYHYYYYYLYHYFNNLRKANPKAYRTSGTKSPQTDSPADLMDMDRTSMENVCHTLLMESVNLVEYYDVIPRDCSLAPIKLTLTKDLEGFDRGNKVNFEFMWNMFDSSTSMRLFAQILCKDYGTVYDTEVSSEFERQIIEASIVECDFAMVLEMFAIENKVTWDFHKRFIRIIRIELKSRKEGYEIVEEVLWDLLSSDWEVLDLVKGIIDDYGLGSGQLGTVLYDFKMKILDKKKEIIRDWRYRLEDYAKENDLRAPFISRDFDEDLYDDRPFLIYQKVECPPDMKRMFRSSYKERLQLLSKFKQPSLLQSKPFIDPNSI